MVGRAGPRAAAKNAPEAVRLAALLDLEQFAHQGQIHAHEPGAPQLLDVAALALPEVALALLGDEVGEPGAEAQRGEVDLVEGDLTEVAPAAEQVGRERVVLVARPAADDDDAAERLQKLGRLLALRELDQLSPQRPGLARRKQVGVVDLRLGHLIAGPEVDLGRPPPGAVEVRVRANVHLALEQDPLVVRRHGDLLALRRQLHQLGPLGLDLGGRDGPPHENVGGVGCVLAPGALWPEEFVDEIRVVRGLFAW